MLCEGLRILVMLLLDTLPMLGNVLMLCFFVFFIFGIVGVQLWAGRLRNRCYLVLPDNISAQRLVSQSLVSLHSAVCWQSEINKSIGVVASRQGGGHSSSALLNFWLSENCQTIFFVLKKLSSRNAEYGAEKSENSHFKEIWEKVNF